MFLHVLGAEALTTFVLDYFLQDVCIANSRGRYRVSLQSRGQFCFLSSVIMSPFGRNVYYQDLGSLAQSSSAVMQILCKHGIHMGPSVFPL